MREIIIAVVLLGSLGTVQAENRNASELAQVKAVMKRSAAEGWETPFLRAHPDAARRQRPFLDYLNDAERLPPVAYDTAGRLHSGEWGKYFQDEEILLLSPSLRSAAAHAAAAVLVHELRHHFDRRIQVRWINSEDAVSSDAEFRAFEAHCLFWTWVHSHGGPAKGEGKLAAELDGNVDDMARGFLKDYVEIAYSPTAKQRLATIGRRKERVRKLMDQLENMAGDPPEGANPDALQRRLRGYEEEERLILTDLDLQARGL